MGKQPKVVVIGSANIDLIMRTEKVPRFFRYARYGGSYMNELIAILKGKKVDDAFSIIGLDFDTYFTTKLTDKEMNPYKEYEWIVKVVPGYGHVINAVPADEKMDELFWEEWFTKDGTIYHHILYLREPAQYDEIFEAPEYDDIHPKQVLGKKWYVIDAKELSPVLLR